MLEENVRKGIVLIIINDKGKYLLLIQRNDNLYSFISGGCELGETESDTVVREAKEETGLKIDRSKLTDTGKFIRFVGGSKGPAQQEVFLYKVDDDNNVIETEDTNEIKGYEWCSEGEVVVKLAGKTPLIKLFQDLKESKLI